MGIKLIRSSPYYAQANGQAEASNQSLIKLIKRKIDEYPRRWHEVLSEALWAYRISCHGSTKTSSYHLVYSQDAMLPWEITVGSRRVEFQNDLTTEQYAALMNDNVEDLTELRLWSLEKIKKTRLKLLVRTTRRSSQRISRLETWFGRQYCHWELKIKSMESGLQLGTGRTRLIRFCLGMHTCSRNWMASSFLLLSMANTSRSISRACGKASDKSRWDPSGCTKIGQHVELAGKKNEWEANTLSWLVKIRMRSKIADV